MIICCVPVCFSQSNGEYVGIAQGKDLESVKISALQNLAQQIHVFISNKSMREMSENAETFKDSMFSNTIAQSFVSLTDVKETIEKTDDQTFKVVKTVSKANVQKMFDMRRKRILDYLDEAERLRSEANTKPSVSLQPMLNNYYQAYLLNTIYPDTLTYYFNSQATSLAVGIPNMLNEIARSIEFIPTKLIDDEYIVCKFLARYNGKEVFKLNYSIYDGMGQSEGEVQNGETQITLYYPKEEKKDRQVQAQLEFLPADELDNTLSIAKKFMNTTPLQKTILINFPGDTDKIAPKIVQQPPQTLMGLVNVKTSFEDVKKEIDLLIKKRIIVQGRASDFETLNGLYCIVVDRPGLIALLKNTNNKYYNYLTNSEVELKEFAGKRILWFELLKIK